MNQLGLQNINLRVLIKEPRGFVRLLQILFSILAWSTTAGFSTKSTLHIGCPDATPYKMEYKIAYPFDLRQTEVSVQTDCRDDAQVVPETFSIDFSATAMLYVLVSIISLAYALAATFCYCFMTTRYENDPLAPMVDLCITALITIFWIIITLTWALNVSDLKYYTNPHYLQSLLSVCRDTEATCKPENPGKWSSLTVSIVCGFSCIAFGLGSMWYVFKETALHKQKQQQQAAYAGQQQQQQTGI